MSELAEVLELVHRGGSGFRTLRATIVTRRDRALVLRARERAADEAERRGQNVLRVRVGFDDRGSPSPPATSTATVRLWFEPPQRLRAETEGEQSSTVVLDGQREWRVRALHEAVVRGPLRLPGEAVPALFLLRPWALLPGHRFEPLGTTVVAGRDALAVRAVLGPADGRRIAQISHFSWGADEHRLALDRRYGILLRAASFLDGEEFEITEMAEVAFDEPIDPDIFRFRPAADMEVLSAEDEARSCRTQTNRSPNPLERMARQASFVLFAPSERSRPVVGSSATFRPDHVACTYTQLWGNESHMVDVVLRPHDGQAEPAEVVSGEGRLVARAVREGTVIEAASRTLDRERLLELLGSLEPVLVTGEGA